MKTRQFFSDLFAVLSVVFCISMMLFAIVAFSLELPYAADGAVSLLALSIFSFALSLSLNK